MKQVKPISLAITLILLWATCALASECSSTVELPLTCPMERPKSLPESTLTYGGVSFRGSDEPPTFRELHELSTSYKVEEENSAIGSLRFLIGIDTDGEGTAGVRVIANVAPARQCVGTKGDGLEAVKNGFLAAYIVPASSYADPGVGTWESTGNLVHSTGAGFEIAEPIPRASAPRMTYDEVLVTLGDLADKPVLYVILVGDGGWQEDHDQIIQVDNLKVNNFKQTANGYPFR